MTNKKIPNILRDTRKQAGMSQAEFAKGLGVSRFTYINWETGANDPDLATLARALQASRPGDWSHDLAVEIMNATMQSYGYMIVAKVES